VTEYYPDVWVIVESQDADSKHHRVLAGWYGGFAHGDSWKLSSGIERIEEKENYWEIHNASGSVYNCHKTRERWSLLTRSIYDTYRDLQEKNNPARTFEHVSFDTVLEQYAKSE